MDNSDVRNVATFHNPFLAIRNGKFEKILAIGDKEGMSPVYLAVDERGRSEWLPIAEYRVCDSSALPLNTEQFRNNLQELTSSRR